MNLQEIVEQTVKGLGYDLVEIERSSGGLLRVTIDIVWNKEGSISTQEFIRVEDCEKVTRQLQYLLEVENFLYSRLEVSSPGIDRLLRNDADFERFTGSLIDIVLTDVIGSDGGGTVHASRKKFRGLLEPSDVSLNGQKGWRITWSDESKVKPGQKVSKHRKPAPIVAMDFFLSEIKEARLASVVNFKGKH